MTMAAMGVIVALACLHLRRHHSDASARAEVAMRARQLASCEARLRPLVHGEVESWRLLDDAPGAKGRQFTFLADVDEKEALFRCDVDAAAVVSSATGPL